MLDLRPVGYVIGLLLAILGVTMLAPLCVDYWTGSGNAAAFVESALLTTLFGGVLALSCANAVREGLTLQQTFLLTTAVWIALPIFGAIPFVVGATELDFTDAMFEAMSGLTTTGSTVLSGLDTLPPGLNLWRAILQWLGGIGIIVVAMVFLPELRVGGMQIFRSEGFDTMGKILPRATTISGQISVIYLGLTLACMSVYAFMGMGPLDAVVHAMTTIATGGFSSHDASFAAFSGPMEYAAALFMILAALPFVRYVQLINGESKPLWTDPQVRGFLTVIAVLVMGTSVLLTQVFPHSWEQAFREALFNITSIISGTGYASADYMLWGSFMVTVFFFVGLIGGCAGSTACSVKIFRYQIMVHAVRAQIRMIRHPSGVFTARYNGKVINDEVLNSVMTFLVFFIVSLGLLAVALSMTGLDFITSLSGAATAIANIGPGLGDVIGPTGNFAPLNDTAKWLLIIGMLVGRLELMAVLVLFTARFWRA